MATNLEREPGDLLTYKDQRTFGIISGKSEVEVTPKYGGSPYKAGDIIRLEIPSQAWLNPEEFYIHWRVSVLPGEGNVYSDAEAPLAANSRKMPYIRDAKLVSYESTVGTNPAIPTVDEKREKHSMAHSVQLLPGTQCVIERMKLLSGTTQIEDIQDYHVLYRAMLEASTSNEWRNGDGFQEEGYWDPKNPRQQYKNANFYTERHGGLDNRGHYFTWKPLLGLFRTGKAIPLKYMGQLTIEIYLAPNTEALYSSSYIEYDVTKTMVAAADGYPDLETASAANNIFAFAPVSTLKPSFPNAYYEIDEIKMHIPFIHPEESYDHAMLQRIESSGLDLHFDTYSMHSRQFKDVGNQQISFQERAVSIKGAIALMRNSPSIRNIQSDMCFYSNMIEWYQWKVGHEYLPAQQILCANTDHSGGAGMALASLKKALGSFNGEFSMNNIKEEDFLIDHAPGEIEPQNCWELARQASQPSKFMLGLDLERSAGQMSGFDSAAASVDIELWMRTRAHHEAVKKRPTPAHQQQGSEVSTLQPTKIRALFAKSEIGGNLLDTESGGTYLKADIETPLYTRGGIMVPLDVTTSYTALTGGKYGNQTINRARSEVGVSAYCRINFFAHIDAVLRLKRVGQIEVVR